MVNFPGITFTAIVEFCLGLEKRHQLTGGGWSSQRPTGWLLGLPFRKWSLHQGVLVHFQDIIWFPAKSSKPQRTPQVQICSDNTLLHKAWLKTNILVHTWLDAVLQKNNKSASRREKLEEDKKWLKRENLPFRLYCMFHHVKTAAVYIYYLAVDTQGTASFVEATESRL